MATTAFGFSSFGHAAFGQSNADSSISIECDTPVYQVAIWYIIGTKFYREVFDIGSSFGDQAGEPVGSASQLGNVVQIRLEKECYVANVYLFDTDEDLSYLNFIQVWDEERIIPQVAGAYRYWDEGSIVVISDSFDDVILGSVSYTVEPLIATVEIPDDSSPLLAATTSEEGISLAQVSYIEIGELDNDYN